MQTSVIHEIMGKYAQEKNMRKHSAGDIDMVYAKIIARVQIFMI